MSKRQPSITQQQISEHPAADGVAWHGDSYFSMRCPFHEDESPSLLVYHDGFQCRAASCGQRGSLASLWDEMQGDIAAPITQVTSHIRWGEILGEDKRPTERFICEAEDAAQFPDVAAWYGRRGLGDMVERCRLGWWRGWFVTPVFDQDGKPLRVVLRAGESIVAPERYRISPGPAVLYVPDWGLLSTKPEYLVVPFGVYDALSAAALRFPAATPLTGCQVPSGLLDPFRRRIYVIPDAEPPEEREKARGLAVDLGWRGHLAEMEYPAGCKDLNDFLQQGKADCLRQQLGRQCYG